MANVTQLKHLEHIEDVMLASEEEGGGVKGCHTAVDWMRQLLLMMGQKGSSSFMQTKWDGAPSVVVGEDPANGAFFVGTKSVFNKKPLIAYSYRMINNMYKKPEVNKKLKYCLHFFRQLDIKGIIQGDLLFTPEDKVVHDLKDKADGKLKPHYIFKPNTITYAIPVDSEMGQKVKQAKIGVVFHTPYGNNFQVSGASVDIKRLRENKNVLVVDNDTPIQDLAVDQNIISAFESNINAIDAHCKKSGKFLNNIISHYDKAVPGKFHIANYIKSYFNEEARQKGIPNADNLLNHLVEWYRSKMHDEILKVSGDSAQEARRKMMFVGIAFLEANRDEFRSMVELYKKIQVAKKLVMKELDRLEEFGTWALTPDGYKVTNPEGYVLHVDGNMIKLVDRLEFSYLNFTLPKQWKDG